MSVPDADLALKKEAPLPRRDWFLLPAISVITVLAMLASCELVARFLWPQQEIDACLITDPSIHLRFRPNCISRVKAAEGPWVDNVYNQCGYRTRESCGTKPPGVIRVAVLGTSYSYGYLTPYSDAFTTLTGSKLTKQCKRPVEFQNLGVVGVSLVDAYRRTDEALALKPDLLLLAIDPFDVGKEISPEQIAHRNDPPLAAAPEAMGPAPAGNWLRTHIVYPLKESRAVLMLQHFMYEEPATYANLYLLYQDTADYLRPPFTPKWQQRFSTVDLLVSEINEKARAASVPMVLLIGPSAAQVALGNSHPRPGIDTNAFNRKIAEIAAKDGIAVVDTLPGFEGHPDPMNLYYAVDGHTAPSGQHLIADSLDKGLIASGYPVFAQCTATQ